jgi:hypothetical protein
MLTSRARRPHLYPQGCLLDYGILDVLDATNPDELHVASYGAWLGEMFLTPSWGASISKTLLVTVQDLKPLLTQLLWPEKPPKLQSSCYARQLRDQKVVQRGTVLMLGDLPQRAAIQLSLQGVLAPVIYAEGVGAWRGTVIPALGPSFEVDLLNPRDVSRALKGFQFEYILPPGTSAPGTYGWNAIPEFKRLFEHTL